LWDGVIVMENAGMRINVIMGERMKDERRKRAVGP
jgi:hypothetical protein